MRTWPIRNIVEGRLHAADLLFQPDLISIYIYYLLFHLYLLFIIIYILLSVNHPLASCTQLYV